jgi:hypothetical protein
LQGLELRSAREHFFLALNEFEQLLNYIAIKTLDTCPKEMEMAEGPSLQASGSMSNISALVGSKLAKKR